ncbi:hypothetical protein AN958_01392 [Leucoagaricus sp. SymC.cos]|nr:hypothetical protein AN958_01392 [Leucoagaricus sp. SymC.cos]
MGSYVPDYHRDCKNYRFDVTEPPVALQNRGSLSAMVTSLLQTLCLTLDAHHNHWTCLSKALETDQRIHSLFQSPSECNFSIFTPLHTFGPFSLPNSITMTRNIGSLAFEALYTPRYFIRNRRTTLPETQLHIHSCITAATSLPTFLLKTKPSC